MLTRREVLQSAAGAGFALNAAAAQGGKVKTVVVAGGGIAGTCCAYELMRRGHNVTVLEASGASADTSEPFATIYPTACT